MRCDPAKNSLRLSICLWLKRANRVDGSSKRSISWSDTAICSRVPLRPSVAPWLYPLCILLAGSVLRIILHLMMGSPLEAGGVLVSELVSWLQLVILVAVVALTPLRKLLDQLRLSIPWLGELEREIATHRFFRVMALMYETADVRVEEMIRTAAKTVTNHAGAASFSGRQRRSSEGRPFPKHSWV